MRDAGCVKRVDRPFGFGSRLNDRLRPVHQQPHILRRLRMARNRHRLLDVGGGLHHGRQCLFRLDTPLNFRDECPRKVRQADRFDRLDDI